MKEGEIKNPVFDSSIQIRAFYKGFEITLVKSLEGEQIGAAIPGVITLVDKLVGQGFESAVSTPVSQPEASKEKKENGVPVCSVHNKAMVERKGQYGMFWACPVKENGEWCKEKPPKK
jgi:hypothetical protein